MHPVILAQKLAPEIRGEVDTSRLARMLYSQDASVYQEEPLGVARPADADDLAAIVRFAAEHRIPLIPRAGGTSLAGQCVGRGLIVDVSRHMTGILRIDPERRRAVVQPGVIQDDLNDALAEHHLMFAPDTSTSKQANIGGMIGNNSCGAYSLVYGSTRDHVLRIKAVLADGSIAQFEPLDEKALEEKKQQDSLEGHIYRTLVDIVDGHRDDIIRHFPKPEIKRRNMGYALDWLAQCRPWNPDGPPFNLAPFICGSEGTLCLAAEAELCLVPKPAHRYMICAHFRSVDEACRATVTALEYGPAAVELMDGVIFEATKHNPAQARNRFWIEGDPPAVLAIEFKGDDADVLRKQADALVAGLKKQNLGTSYPSVEGKDIDRVWALRKAGMGLITGIPGDNKPLPAIEDAAVAPADLPAFVKDIEALMAKHDCHCVFYGHASVGLLHFRPMLNLKQPRDIHRFQAVLEDTAELIRRYGGSLSGEHGDGRLRGPLIKKMFPPEVYDLLWRVKTAFDPEGRLNPQSMLNAPPVTMHLRVHPDSPAPVFETYFDWSRTQGFLRAAEACNGAGFCRQRSGRGTMCPSYMATGEEAFTTRGRANVLRQVLSSSDPGGAWTDPDLAYVLDTCLSCKGCAAECPSNVDMARLKAEVLQQRMDRRGASKRSMLFAHFAFFGQLAGIAPALISRIMNWRVSKIALGIAPRRSIPAFAHRTFLRQCEDLDVTVKGTANGRVLLLPDEFTQYTDPEPGLAAAQFLTRAGYEVVLPPQCVNSGRAQISKGFVRRARAAMEKTIAQVDPLAADADAVIGIEPSALLGLRDEAPDLVAPEHREAAARIKDKALLFEEFIAREREANRLDHLEWKDGDGPQILLHGHCHQKALSGTAPLVTALHMIPGAEIIEIPSGCCGMAGSFGYEREHYELSMAIGEQVLFPEIRKHPEALICASGTSCRHQILDGTGRTAQHTAQILLNALA